METQNTNNSVGGRPNNGGDWFRWITLLITIITLNTTAILYVAGMGTAITVCEEKIAAMELAGSHIARDTQIAVAELSAEFAITRKTVDKISDKLDAHMAIENRTYKN